MKVAFTLDQIQQIINTIAELPAKACFDTLTMITQEVAKQTKSNDGNDQH